MALKKQIELESGVVADYWKITNIFQNYLQENTSISIAGYVSKEIRQEGKQPTVTKTFLLPLIDSENIRASAYEALKEQELFIGSENN